MPFIALHLACLAVIWVGWSWTAVIVAVVLYYARMFALTAFYHRYFAHRSFKTSRPVQFLLALAGGTAVQRGALWWASVHRHHHRVSDDLGDPHSPVQHGFFWSHIGWVFSRSNFHPRLERIKDFAAYPELRFLDRFDTLVPMVLGGLLLAAGAWLERTAPHLGVTVPQLFVWGLISTVVLFHGTSTINSVSHLVGRRRYATTDGSRNFWPLVFITLGEGWHNNHHHYPAASRLGHRWWEIDPAYGLLKILSWMGLIWDLRPVPQAVLNTAGNPSLAGTMQPAGEAGEI